MHIPTVSATLDRRHRGNPEIEFLRAFAISFVIVMHVPVLCIPYPATRLERIQDWIMPATGVDLFFVVSGYLIGRSFMGPFEANEHLGTDERVRRITAFWVRRFYRLFPASALWIGLILLACLVSGDVSLWLTPRRMFLKSVMALISMRNFEEARFPSFFGYFWSLSVEDQFYLALPVLLFVTPRRVRVPGLVLLCALNAVWRPGGGNWWMFRYDGLIYGVLLFELERSGQAARFARALPTTLAGRVGLMLFGGLMVLVPPLALKPVYPLAQSLVNCGAFVLVFAASRERRVIVAPYGTRTALLWLGARSYSLYLCHIPVWFAVIDAMRRTGFGGPGSLGARFAIGLPLSLLAADLTYRLVELPLQARGRVVAREILFAEPAMARPDRPA